MKVEGYTSYLNSDNNTNSVEVNFGRVMKFVISGAGLSTVYEFSPLKNETLTPRLEALVNCRPQVGSGMNTSMPGFSAKLTIYNPGEDIIKILTNTARFPQKDKIATNTIYRATKGMGRPSVQVYAGYWDFEHEKENYNGIFTGYLNSSSLYRKGVDTILEMWCHNVEMTNKNFSTWIADNASESEKLDQLNDNTRVVSGGTSYLNAIRTLIKTLAHRRSRHIISQVEAPFTSYGTNNQPEVSPREDPNDDGLVTSDERNRDDWIEIFTTTKAYTGPSEIYTADSDLMNDLKSTAIPKDFKFYNAGSEGDDVVLEQQLKELLKTFPYGSVKFEPEYVAFSNRFRWYFWRPTGGSSGSSSSSSASGSSKTHVIEDFQNFIEPPTCNGNGQIVMRMMFYPALVPMDNIMLRWDQYKTNTIISDKVQGGMVNASMGYYAPLIQAGRYSLSVYALTQSTTGDIFNEPMKMVSVIHDLSTTSSKWSTTVTTAGLDYDQAIRS